MTWSNVQDAISVAWTDVIDRIIGFIPELLGAFVILIIGWLVAVLLDRLFDRVLRSVGLQDLFEKIRLENVVRRSKIELDTTALLGRLLKWVVLLVAFLAAADVLGLPRVAEFFDRILVYAPNVIVAAAVLVIGSVLASFLAEVVEGSVRAGRLAYASFLGAVVRWSIWIFAVLVALYQLGIAANLIATLFTGVVAMLAIAGGLSFGLGGQDLAREVLEQVREGIRSEDIGDEDDEMDMEMEMDEDEDDEFEQEEIEL